MNLPKKRSLPVIQPVNTNIKLMKQDVEEQKLNCKNEKDQKNTNKDNVFESDRLITGTVDFILRIQKVYPNICCFFEVYGFLVKVSRGKYFGQNILILKNMSGPALQGIYYNFDTNDLINVENGQLLSCVGRFLSSTKNFHIFKFNVISKFPTEGTFSRIQTVCNYSLKTSYKKLLN